MDTGRTYFWYNAVKSGPYGLFAIYSANLGLYFDSYTSARPMSSYFFKDACISVRVKPFVSGKSKYAYTKKMKQVAAYHRKFTCMP